MSTKIVQIKVLYPGQKVTIANCAAVESVVRRTGKGKYVVTHKGGEVEIPRTQLCVSVRGAWKSGAVNEIL